MTAKEYLSRAYKIELQVSIKLEKLEQLRALAERTTTTLSKEPRGQARKDSTENILVKLVSLEEEIKSDISALLDVKKEVQTAIKSVLDPELRMVLEMRYLCYQSWSEIADQLHCNIRHAHRLHGEALLAVKI